jgi:hypothetical protein
MELTTHTTHGIDKTARYGWVTKDGPGELRMLHKDLLQVHPAYQRDLLLSKVRSITAAWSWISVGALVVGERGGEFWVIDGQHRAMAAKRRSDITHLPCVVFQTADVKTEARGFLDLNTGRKPVTAVAKQKALVAAGDETALFVNQLYEELGLEMRATAAGPGHIKCVARCMQFANESRQDFRLVLQLTAELCTAKGMPVAERLMESLWFLHFNVEGGLLDKRLNKRIREKGARVLLDAANRAAAFYSRGGAKVWANGILEELNKGLQHKFSLEKAK